MKRIGIAGFQHETNTFSDKPADFQAFIEADGWPGLSRGTALLENLQGYNIGVTGLIEGAQAHGWDIVPLTWAYGGAGGRVTTDAFERICSMLLNDLENSGPLDGLLLDLHGAMVTQNHDDGEGELLRRIRGLVGPELPIVACLDLHANITEEMVALTDQLVIYRTYPHLDMAGTGVRAAHALAEIMALGRAADYAFRQLPFIIPTTVGCTLSGPAKWLYDKVGELEKQPGIRHISFACGFNPSDVAHVGPSLLVYGDNPGKAEALAELFCDEITAREHEFVARLWTVEDAVAHAIAKARDAKGPIILADVQDNYGGGAYSDTNWIFAELVRQRAQKACVGVLCDPEVAHIACEAGIGAEISVALGAKSAQLGHEPYRGLFRVEAISDGNICSTGEYFAGGMMKLGSCALLQLDGVKVVVSSVAEQAADQAMFTHFGVVPQSLSILSVKSTVHYRADFQSIAGEILEVVAPAPMIVDEGQLSYTKVRAGLRLPNARPLLENGS